ncbi:Holliday junction-specific endonuclease [Candidatus Mycoplasma haematolamae str. Purdue]|uniref:Holliday junction resolvase RecU n=1 Tax=Mycoplasma haematolamae (strain Purdue) TaxID=1212765 RepID=I7CEV5_MYCHA|nr:Holliday junction resolvase RecU [Candidatus Mycoplasma haematolamae]AFO51786.1 Holliday junction-specific endonuclease [Candidatus Mycoplasma haematolamae str. Purdue]
MGRYITHNNRGSIVEQLMLNTSEYYRSNGIAYFRKSNPEYSHVSKRGRSSLSMLDEDSFRIRLISKGDLDYYGVYKGKYFGIELKETKRQEFCLSLLKEHQWTQLEEISSCGGISLLLIHFLHKESSFWLISYSQLLKLRSEKKRKIFSLEEFKKVKAFELSITYPYVFDLVPVLDQLISHLKS